MKNSLKLLRLKNPLINPLTTGTNKMSHILKQICSFCLASLLKYAYLLLPPDIKELMI